MTEGLDRAQARYDAMEAPEGVDCPDCRRADAVKLVHTTFWQMVEDSSFPASAIKEWQQRYGGLVHEIGDWAGDWAASEARGVRCRAHCDEEDLYVDR